ncbi:MAG: STAS domain-containing protein [Bacteroidetes bacterium]|nr:STAS domain-containing protein [Bacteroidota bacterium]
MFFTHTVKKKGAIYIFALTGELIEKNQAEKLMQDVDEVILNNNIRFIIDLSALKYLNSSGLTILIQILTKARKAGGEAVIAHVGKRIKELLVITKLNTVFSVTDTVEQGISKLNKLVSN